MIPFTIAVDGELLNVSQIVRLVDKTDNGYITVFMTDGSGLTYTGKAAEIIKHECQFLFTMYQGIKREATSQIVQPSSAFN